MIRIGVCKAIAAGWKPKEPKLSTPAPAGSSRTTVGGDTRTTVGGDTRTIT